MGNTPSAIRPMNRGGIEVDFTTEDSVLNAVDDDRRATQ